MKDIIPVAQPDLKGNELKYVHDCINSNWISSKGEYVERFEVDFARYCDVSFGVSTSNGTTALHLALAALGIGAGDEVIIPDLTFAATINAVIYTGAKPVLVDVEDESWTIDPEEIIKNITAKTKAIIPVHLYGQPCDMDEIMNIAKNNNLFVIEDCAEAHGAEYRGKKVGSFGDVACFSFYGNKIITTGEGGMCLTNNEKIYKKMTMLRDHGMDPDNRYWHMEVGFNYRLTNLQAAVGLAQLEKIGQILKQRSLLEIEYNNCLKDVGGISLQKQYENRKKVCWMYSILIDEEKYGLTRDKLMFKLSKNNIDSRQFFYPLHEMSIYRKYGTGKYTNSKKISEMGINLPTYNGLTKEEIIYIIKIIQSSGMLSEL